MTALRHSNHTTTMPQPNQNQHSTRGFDLVFLTETLDHNNQAAFLADVMGVPRNAAFSLRKKNAKMRKSSEREKTHFYQDLLRNLTLEGLSWQIHEENELEIELFEYAVELNRKKVERWKEESGWNE